MNNRVENLRPRTIANTFIRVVVKTFVAPILLLIAALMILDARDAQLQRAADAKAVVQTQRPAAPACTLLADR